MICEFQQYEYYQQVVSNYRDNFGLIVQEGKDGGDAAHRIGTFYFGMYLIFKDNKVILKKVKKDFEKELSKIKVDKGVYVRHPDKTKWYSNPRNFSRDQTFPIVLALGVFDEKEELIANLDNLVKSGSFYPNDLKNWSNEQKKLPSDYNDLAFIGDYGNYIRSLKRYEFYPYLMFSDLTLVVSSIIRVGFSYFDKTDTSDDLNMSLNLLQAEEFMPTPSSYLAKWIYTTFKARNFDNDLPIISAWNYYYRKEGGAPPMNKVYDCLLRKNFYD